MRFPYTDGIIVLEVDDLGGGTVMQGMREPRIKRKRGLDSFKVRSFFLLLYPISLLLVALAKYNSYFAEYIFARGIYRYLSQGLSILTGWIPFSLAELTVIALPIFLFLLLYRFVRKILNDVRNRRKVIVNGLLNLLCGAGVLLFSYVLLAGMNYYRYNFSYYSNLEIQESSLDELIELTEQLVADANYYREQTLGRTEEGVFELTANVYELAKESNQAMKKLGDEYAVLGGIYGKAKPILLSKLMSYTEITGIFVPFTMEANVNVDIPDYSIPVTMLHELAHLRGFMREDEANYIAYLAGINSDSMDLKYSSTMLALTIAGNAIYDQNKDLYFEVRELYSEGIKKDLRANSEYWSQYEDTVVSTISNRINDTYLKINDQVDGVRSYGRMLDLLLAKHRKDSMK